MLNRQLRDLYYKTHKAHCCKCGCGLEDNDGCGLGTFFVLDKNGNFYCMGCDEIFEDGDERIFEPEFCEAEGKEIAERIIDDVDMYNSETEIYAFHYNDKDAICIYHISVDKAIELAKEAKEQNEYWGSLLGIGGLIFSNPEDFIQAYGVEDGWITCEEFLDVINKEA